MLFNDDAVGLGSKGKFKHVKPVRICMVKAFNELNHRISCSLLSLEENWWIILVFDRDIHAKKKLRLFF